MTCPSAGRGVPGVRRALLLATLAAALAAPAASAAPAAPAPLEALATAELYVVKHLKIGGLKDTHSLRSRRNRSWALVDGFYTKPKRASGPGIWAVWLQLRKGGWVVRYAGIDRKATQPPARLGAPCDIQPAFSEPFC